MLYLFSKCVNVIRVQTSDRNMDESIFRTIYIMLRAPYVNFTIHFRTMWELFTQWRELMFVGLICETIWLLIGTIWLGTIWLWNEMTLNCNFSHVCLLVEMASKTVTRSINKMIITQRKILGSFTNSPDNSQMEMKDRKINCGQRINLNFNIYKPAFKAIIVLVHSA